MAVRVKKIAMELAAGTACAFGGFLALFYSLDKVVLWRFELELHFPICVYLSMFLGLPVGCVLGIWLVDKIIFKSEGYNLAGALAGFAACDLGVIAIWFLWPRRWSVGMLLIPLVGACFALSGYNATELSRASKQTKSGRIRRITKVWWPLMFKLVLLILLVPFLGVTVFAWRLAWGNASVATAIYHGLIIGNFLGVPYSILVLIMLQLSRNRFRVVVPAALCVCVVGMGILCKGPSPPRLFTKVVVSPIPESVQDIKADLWYVAHDYVHILNFKIGQDDVNDILNSKGFHGVQDVNYDGETLRWRSSLVGHTFRLFDHRDPPSWFDLESWKLPEMYEVNLERERHQHYLIYNSELKEAYFIDFKW